jgi:hypothetical protein
MQRQLLEIVISTPVRFFCSVYEISVGEYKDIIKFKNKLRNRHQTIFLGLALTP